MAALGFLLIKQKLHPYSSSTHRDQTAWEKNWPRNISWGTRGSSFMAWMNLGQLSCRSSMATRTGTHAHARANANTHAHAYERARMHRHTNTHTRAHTHSMALVGVLDEPLSIFLTMLSTNHIMDNTVIILASDHGTSQMLDCNSDPDQGAYSQVLL